MIKAKEQGRNKCCLMETCIMNFMADDQNRSMEEKNHGRNEENQH